MATTQGMDEATIVSAVADLRASFVAGRTRPASWRREQLDRLHAMIVEREGIFLEALREDLGKPVFEAWLGEIGFLANEASSAQKHLRAWMQPERVTTPLAVQPGKSRIEREPLGVALIIAPWNYPLQLALSPLIGAIAAGNCAIIKPSELAPMTAAAMAEWVPKYLDTEAVRVIEGGAEETQVLLRQRFDYIFYTGGGRVGRIVMRAAAEHLTPVTLELGGKSPCLVDASVDLAVAARRIAWGKFFNAGQTCVCPDYVLAHRDVAEALLARLEQTIRTFYGDDPKKSPDYGRIINDRHFDRLAGLLGAGQIVTGGIMDANQRYLAPTVIAKVPPGAAVMEDEIFGPILPVIEVDSMDAAIRFVNDRPKPLALYVFSSNKATADRVLSQTSSGGACVNDVVAHLGVPDLPFGGVGESGMGAYHGRASFEAFSHRKAVLRKGTRVDPALRYPPYDDSKLTWAKRLI